jgi:uncharacterized protein (TIGR02285 family)
MKILNMFFLFSVLCINSLSAYANKITWMTIDWPPYEYKENAEYKGYGIDLIKILQKELPMYQHEFQQANTARIMHNLKQGKHVCSLGFFKSPKRDQFVHYSIPDAVWFPVQLFMRRDTFKALGSPSELSLHELIEGKRGILGISNDISYAKEIDNILNQFQGSKQIKVNYAGNITKNLFAMLLINRIDFVIDFPPEGKYAAELLNAREQVISVPIKEHMTLSASHTLCPQNPCGKAVIANINKALLKQRLQPNWREGYENVIDAQLIPLYRKKYNDLLFSN